MTINIRNRAVDDWVRELRSTELEQGRFSLRLNGEDWDCEVQSDAYCCLGIACEISGIGEWLWRDDDSEYAYAVDDNSWAGQSADAPTGCLPAAVQRQLGVADSLGHFTVTKAWLDALETAYPATAARFGAYMRSNNWAHDDYVAAVANGEISGTATLSSLNDWGLTFREIADIIESQPPGLFVE